MYCRFATGLKLLYGLPLPLLGSGPPRPGNLWYDANRLEGLSRMRVLAEAVADRAASLKDRKPTLKKFIVFELN